MEEGTQNTGQNESGNAETIGDIEVGAFNAALQEATGGKVNSVDDFEGLLTVKDQYSDIQNKYNVLEAKSKISPYHNPFVEKLNGMYKDGAKDNEIHNFVRLQSLDIENLDGEKALKERLRYEYPGYSDKDIQYAIEEMVGEAPEKNEDDDDFNLDTYNKLLEKRNSKINREGLNAKDFLKERLVDSSNPEAIKKREEADAHRDALKTQWNTVLQPLVKSNPLSFSMENEKIGGKYEFNFTPPENPQNEANLLNYLVNYAAQEGLEVKEDNLPKLMQEASMAQWMTNKDAYLESMVLDMYASLNESLVKKYSNVGPKPAGQTPGRVDTRKKTKSTPQKRKGYV